MKMTQLYQDVEVTVKELAPNFSPPHRHNFFELIYVLEGNGIHRINNNNFNYSKGNVFLLTPEDSHTFKSGIPAKFCIIDFTKNFLSKSNFQKRDRAELSDFFIRLEYVFHNHHNIKGDIIANESDRKLMDILFLQLVAENENRRIFQEIITQNIVFLLLHIVVRNIQQGIASNFKQENPKNKVHEITAYIQQNIYNKELIKIEKIAVHFNKSADHLSRYFKKQTGITMKEYIIQYKLNLIKTRLTYSDLTISEIAHEMNFTDESHLNKLFKNHYGKTVSQFKKEVLLK